MASSNVCHWLPNDRAISVTLSPALSRANPEFFALSISANAFSRSMSPRICSATCSKGIGSGSYCWLTRTITMSLSPNSTGSLFVPASTSSLNKTSNTDGLDTTASSLGFLSVTAPTVFIFSPRDCAVCSNAKRSSKAARSNSRARSTNNSSACN